MRIAVDALTRRVTRVTHQDAFTTPPGNQKQKLAFQGGKAIQAAARGQVKKKVGVYGRA